MKLTTLSAATLITFATIGDEARDILAVRHIMGHAGSDIADAYREKISGDRLRAVAEHVGGWLFPQTMAQRKATRSRPAKPQTKKGVQAAPKSDPAAEKARKEEIQGVFVVQGEKALFRKVETGITGATDIEVLNGLKDGEQIVTGSYQVIRTLRNEAKVKVDNRAPTTKSGS